MAINIFEKDLPELNESSEISLEAQIKYALEAFQASLKIRGIQKLLKDYTDEVVIYGVNKVTKEPETIVIEEEADMTNILPIMMYFAISKTKEPLLPTSDIHVFNRYVKNTTPEDLSSFILEIEGLKHLLYETYDFEEEDQTLNISIYPQLSRFMLDFKQLYPYMTDDKHIPKQYVKDVIKFIYETIIQMNIKRIYKSNIDNPIIDFKHLDKAQKVDYISTNYHFETEPIDTKLTTD
jgi:hypothetical protein